MSKRNHKYNKAPQKLYMGRQKIAIIKAGFRCTAGKEFCTSDAGEREPEIKEWFESSNIQYIPL